MTASLNVGVWSNAQWLDIQNWIYQAWLINGV